MFFKGLVIAAVAALSLATRQAHAQVVVIVNEANPVASLTKADAKAFFMKSSGSWKHGEKVRPVDYAADAPERAVFLKAVLGLSASEVERYWIEKQYASAEAPPVKAADADAVLKLVRSQKGGIGFLSKAEFDAGDKSGVKAVLTIAP